MAALSDGTPNVILVVLEADAARWASVNGGLYTDTTPVLGDPRENYGVITDTTIRGGAVLPARAGISVTHVDGLLELHVENNTVTGYHGEDATGNGVINPGDDVNGNGVLDPGEAREVVR